MSSAGFSLMFDNGGFFLLAAAVLCCYEHAITFSDEVKYVWRRQISGATVLFLLNRYGILAVSVASLVQVLPWHEVYGNELFPDFAVIDVIKYTPICNASVRFVDCCIILLNVVYVVFASLRMFALYGMSKLVLAIVLSAGLLNPFTQIFLMSIEGVYATNPLVPVGYPYVLGRVNCDHDHTLRSQAIFADPSQVINVLLLALHIHSIAFEAVLIGLTWRKAFTRENGLGTVCRTPFTTILLRNGTLYFVIVAVTSALNAGGMIQSVVWYKDYATSATEVGVFFSMISPVVDTLTSICMSRFILNLLAVALDNCDDSLLHTSQWKTIRFADVAETMVRNLGADMHSTLLEHDEVDAAEPTDEARSVRE